MNHISTFPNNSRSPMTLGDFIKSRKGNKSSPENSGKFLKRQAHSFGGWSSSNPRNLFCNESDIDFSVNDIEFDKINNKDPLLTEMKWSVNDVQFSLDNGAPCNYVGCLQNDTRVRPFNNFRLRSYSSDDSDSNVNTEQFFMAESSVSYFPFERVEDAEDGSPEDEGFYGTTYYSLQDQLCNNQQRGQGEEAVEDVEDVMQQMETINIKQNKTQEGFEKDEELNNLVLSIIDDE